LVEDGFIWVYFFIFRLTEDIAAGTTIWEDDYIVFAVIIRMLLNVISVIEGSILKEVVGIVIDVGEGFVGVGFFEEENKCDDNGDKKENDKNGNI